MAVTIKSYEDGVVSYYCSECDLVETYDISEMLTEDCALDIDIMCKECKDVGVLYMLKCANAALAKDLNAKLEVLRLNREAGVSKNDYKASE